MMDSFESSFFVTIKKEEKEMNEIDLNDFTNYASSDIRVKNEPITDDFPHEEQLINFAISKHETTECDLPVETAQKRELELPKVIESQIPIKPAEIKASAGPRIILNKQVDQKRSLNTTNALPIKKLNKEKAIKTVNREEGELQPMVEGIPKVTKKTTLSTFLKANESNSSKTNVTTPIEIKVKCLCRLGLNSDLRSSGESNDLISFFDYMLKETRCLPLKQQRIIKLSLLQAICGAENCMEEGKNCQRCCP